MNWQMLVWPKKRVQYDQVFLGNLNPRFFYANMALNHSAEIPDSIKTQQQFTILAT